MWVHTQTWVADWDLPSSRLPLKTLLCGLCLSLTPTPPPAGVPRCVLMTRTCNSPRLPPEDPPLQTGLIPKPELLPCRCAPRCVPMTRTRNSPRLPLQVKVSHSVLMSDALAAKVQQLELQLMSLSYGADDCQALAIVHAEIQNQSRNHRALLEQV